METINIILLVVGIVVLLFGVGAFLYPNLARWINAPGGPRLKAIIAAIIGIILVVIAFIIEIPMK
jgi:hypothetical protein